MGSPLNGIPLGWASPLNGISLSGEHIGISPFSNMPKSRLFPCYSIGLELFVVKTKGKQKEATIVTSQAGWLQNSGSFAAAYLHRRRRPRHQHLGRQRTALGHHAVRDVYPIHTRVLHPQALGQVRQVAAEPRRQDLGDPALAAAAQRPQLSREAARWEHMCASVRLPQLHVVAKAHQPRPLARDGVAHYSALQPRVARVLRPKDRRKVHRTGHGGVEHLGVCALRCE
eukprot:365194-Chlamydomonas_euryale.AAC.4